MHGAVGSTDHSPLLKLLSNTPLHPYELGIPDRFIVINRWLSLPPSSECAIEMHCYVSIQYIHMNLHQHFQVRFVRQKHVKEIT